MRAHGFLSPSGFLVTLALAALIPPFGVFAGDVATFQDLGFSPDARVYVFAQFGVDEQSSLPYADLFAVEVATNRFVPEGVRRATYENPVEPGDSGIGALFNLVGNAQELLKRHRVDHTRTGRLVYILLNGAEPKHDLEFRDFETGLHYRITLIQANRGSGANVEAAFHLQVTIETAKGDTATYTVGLPDYWRRGVKQYRIKQVTLAPDKRSLVFVIQREELDKNGDNIRYMVETLRPGR